MAFTITFPTSGPCPDRTLVSGWLSDRGEPFEAEGTGTIALRAMAVRFVVSPDQDALQAHLEVTAAVPLSRMVDMLFGISVEAGADVRLAGSGEITKAALWMVLADEQDRIRIAETLERAKDHGNIDAIMKRMWAVVSALRPHCDDRWDAQRQRIVRLREIGGTDGLSIEEAQWHAEDPQVGDVVPVPVDRAIHIHSLTWRWLSEAYPSIAQGAHSH